MNKYFAVYVDDDNKQEVLNIQGAVYPMSDYISNCHQRDLFEMLCDRVGVNHLTPKSEVLSLLSENLKSIK